MAEGGEFVDLSAEEDMLSCSVCMEEYEDPRALPCLHTFCYKCLVQVTLKGTMDASPEMKLASYIGNLKVAEFPKLTLIHGILLSLLI